MTKGNLRGHPIYWDGHQFLYLDDNTRTVGNPRGCAACKLPDREDGHDACLGELPGVMNACCGHGDVGEAYIQYPNGHSLRGALALKELGKKAEERDRKSE